MVERVEEKEIERKYKELLEKAIKMPGLADLMRLYGDVSKYLDEVEENDECYYAMNSDTSSFF